VTCKSEAYDSTLVEVYNQGTLNFRLHAFEPSFESKLNRRLENLEKAPVITIEKTGFSKKLSKTLSKMLQDVDLNRVRGAVTLLKSLVDKADSNQIFADKLLSVFKGDSNVGKLYDMASELPYSSGNTREQTEGIYSYVDKTNSVTVILDDDSPSI
jgi:hypothetical protein